MGGSAPFGFDGPVEVVAHRGYSAQAPENTLAALELAISVGADALEFDLHTSSDGTPVLFHDDTLDRTTDGSGPVGAATAAELAELDAGSWFDHRFGREPVPTLARALDAVRGRVDRVYPEVKAYGNAGALATIARLVGDAGLVDTSVFISMDWDALEAIRVAEGRALLGYIVERPERTDAALERATGDPRALLDFDARILLADPEIAERAHAAGVPLACWTVNDVATAERLRTLGVPRITTNEVGALVAWKAKL
jgi:glycerophosphoryl diester phosphodiesterase